MNSTTIQLEWSSLACASRGQGVDGFFVLAQSLGDKLEAEKKNKVRNSRPFAKVHRHRSALWVKITNNPDVITGPLARLFACTVHSFPCSAMLAALTHSLAPSCSLLPTLRHARFACALRCAQSFAHLAHSLSLGTVNDWMAIYSLFFFLFWTIVRWKSQRGCR